MKKFVTVFVCLIILGLAGEAADEAPVVNVTWENPAGYFDIRATNEPQRKFEQQLFGALTEFIEKESVPLLSSGQQLNVTIHNLDMAGFIQMNGLQLGEEIRVIRDSELVMMEIEHSWLDASGEVISEERKKYTGMYTHSLRADLRRGRSFHYEKKVLRDWLDHLEEVSKTAP